MGEATFQFTFQGDDIKEAMYKAAFLMDKDHCWLDGFKDQPVWFDVREAKTNDGEFIYIKRKCRSADGNRIASSTLGEYKGGKGYFWNKWEVWNKEKGEMEETGTSYTPKSKEEEDALMDGEPF